MQRWKRRVVARLGLGPTTEWQRRAQRWRPWLRARLGEDVAVWRARGLRATIDEPLIVIPSIGRSELRAAVDSALSQTVPCHVVVVLDGQPGPSLPADSRLTVLELREGLKVAGAVRNVAMRTFTAPAYAFLDDDNVLDPRHLELCLPALRAGVTLAYSQAARFDPDGQLVDVVGEVPGRATLRKRNYVDASCILLVGRWRWSRVPRHGDEFGEDWELAWRAMRRPSRVAYVPLQTVRYSVRRDFADYLQRDRPSTG